MSSNTTRTASRGRLLLARVLVVIGLVLGIISLLAGYVRWQVFDTATFEDTAAALIADEEIRSQVSATLVEQLYANVDVQAELAAQLPADQQGLAGPLTGALRQLSDRAAFELLGRPRVQALFVTAATTAQKTAERALDDELGPTETQDGYIVLDLHDAVVELADQLSFLGDVAQKLPADVGVVRLVEADRFETAQTATKLFKSIAFVLPFVVLALLGAGVWLAAGRRRRELRAIGVGLVLAGIVTLALRSVAGGFVVDQVSPTTTVEPAVESVWSILTDLLADGGWMAIILGLATLLGVWLSADGGLGARARHALAPVLARRMLGYPVFAAILLLLVWWQPTVQFGRLLPVVIFAALLAAALEGLRALVLREDPDAAAADPVERLRELVPRSGERTPVPAGGVDYATQLERLSALHGSGSISEEDYLTAKMRVIHG